MALLKNRKLNLTLNSQFPHINANKYKSIQLSFILLHLNHLCLIEIFSFY